MIRYRSDRTVVLLLALLVGSAAWAERDSYDELPEGAPGYVARFYFSALSLPEVGDWNREQRLALLDAATLRYRDRLVNRASRTSPETALRHVERLAAMEAPPGPAIGQTCAQFALLDGPCAEHAGYVRRVEVVEELRDTASSTVLA